MSIIQLKMKKIVAVKTILEPGILIVDKPTGITSHTVVNWARKNSGIKKVGHTGTLDPLATGLLILLIGKEYTKLQDQYLKQDKTYECVAKLGLTTDTYDIDGEKLIKSSWDEISKISLENIQDILPSFTGNIEQQVPIFSAVRKNGRKLYKLARAAKHDPNEKEKVTELLKDLPSRNITIHSLSIDDFIVDPKNQESFIKFTVSCSSGTYIRSLAHDMGETLGVGATVISLRRTKIGEISINEVKFCPMFYRNSDYLLF
jgi:tRNA pseudouridine55 synthase